MVATAEELDEATAASLTAYYRQLLAGFGLEDLADFAARQATLGVGEAEFINNLENQPAYRERFAPIFERRELGLPPITATHVLAFRRQMAELEQFYRLPEGTLDSDRFLVQDVSFNEAQARVAFAAQLRDDEDPAVLAELEAMGVSEGSVIALALDTERAMTAIQEEVRTARLTVGGRRGGFNLTTEEAAALEDRGIDPQALEQRAAALTTSGDLRTGLGGSFEALSRGLELEILAGSGLAIDELERRRRRVQSRFESGGGFRTDRSGGAFGLGSA